MNILIAPNAFKGSLSAEEAAASIAEGFRQSKLFCKLTLMPIADGGDGTAALIAKKMDSQAIDAMVHDPLGRIIKSSFGFLADEKTAIIEMSDASGLRLLKKEDLNPLVANTRGFGELIRAALDKGAEKLLLGVGGSATVDGATGLLRELGIRFFNERGDEIVELPMGLTELKTIDISGLDPRLRSCEIIVLCDVQNTLLGNKGSARVFGPQKGANKNEIFILEKCLQQLNQITEEALGVGMASLIYGGAAGGVAAGLAVFLNAKLVSGIEFFLDTILFDSELQKVDLVITAEGSLDAQTMEGKGPYGVAKRAKNKKIPVIALAGQISLQIKNEMRDYFDAILPIGHAPVSMQEAIQNTSTDLMRSSCELGNLLALEL